jgi:hypothetical protein
LNYLKEVTSFAQAILDLKWSDAFWTAGLDPDVDFPALGR